MGRIEKQTRKQPASADSDINEFQVAVDKCKEITGTTCPGLSAMGGNSILVKLADTLLAMGSVDIDSAVKQLRPDDPRWDYVIGYRKEAFFIEVHPADTSNVQEMIKKVRWLKNWLDSVATDLKNLHKCGCYHWIPSGRMNILRNSTQYRSIAANKLHIAAKPLRLK